MNALTERLCILNNARGWICVAQHQFNRVFPEEDASTREWEAKHVFAETDGPAYAEALCAPTPPRSSLFSYLRLL